MPTGSPGSAAASSGHNPRPGKALPRSRLNLLLRHPGIGWSSWLACGGLTFPIDSLSPAPLASHRTRLTPLNPTALPLSTRPVGILFESVGMA